MASSPAYEKYPEHTIEVVANPSRIRVEFEGETIVDTTRAVTVLEGSYPPVVYVPREDAKMEVFEKTEHTTFCPFKGHASYFSLRIGDRLSENAVWSYEDPYDQVARLKDTLAFYPDRIDSLIED